MTRRDVYAKGPFFILGCGDRNHDIVTFDYARCPNYDAFLTGGRLPEGTTTTYQGRGARTRRALASGLFEVKRGALIDPARR